jgi:hypothetical protein
LALVAWSRSAPHGFGPTGGAAAGSDKGAAPCEQPGRRFFRLRFLPVPKACLWGHRIRAGFQGSWPNVKISAADFNSGQY